MRPINSRSWHKWLKPSLKKYAFILSLLLLINRGHAQTLPQYLNINTEVTKSVDLDYLLYVPEDYHPSQGKPLLLFLTSDEYSGDINLLRNVGPLAQVEGGMSLDYFVAAPLLPGDVLWDTEVLVALLDHIQSSYHIESSEIWLTGLGDRGGWGAWELALLHPELFAKFAPVASSPGTNVWSIHEMSTWIFHGALDEMVPIEDAEVMYYELNWDDVDVQLTIFDSLGHDIGDVVYTDPNFYEWLTGETPQYGSGVINPTNRSMHASIVKSIDDNYLLYLPVGYNDDLEEWPLVIYLHGSGSAITDIEAIREGGPPELFEEGMDSDFILLCPQLHDDVHWDVDRIHALTLEIMNTYRVNDRRVYLTGLSRGGFGAWEYGVTHPNLFAGIVPISARDVAGVERLVNNSVWIFHGDQDTGVPWQGSQVAFNRLNALDADVHLTLYAGVGHWAWEPAYATEGLWIWLLSKENELVPLADLQAGKPQNFVLEQNFPNPFNPSTTIRYGLPEASNVSLVIYGLRGNVIYSPASEPHSAGWYDVTWDGQSNAGKTIPTGFYFAHITAGDYHEVIKMLYLK